MENPKWLSNEGVKINGYTQAQNSTAFNGNPQRPDTNNKGMDLEDKEGVYIKRREIPTKLIKRVHKTENESLEEEKGKIAALPFRARKNTSVEKNKKRWEDEYKNVDMPPKKSLLDLNGPVENELEDGLVIDNPDFLNLTDRPNDYMNAFNRYSRSRMVTSVAKEKSEKRQNLPFVYSDSTSAELKDKASKSEPNSTFHAKISNKSVNGRSKEDYERFKECAVIVYGFQDSNFDLIVEHFAKFGTIVEDFDNAENGAARTKYVLPMIIMNEQLEREKSSNTSQKRKKLFAESSVIGSSNEKTNTIRDPIMRMKNYPIFVGEGWVKITYMSTTAAIRALRENGSRDDQGSTVGVVPYTRKEIESLLGRQIPDELDVGNGLSSLHFNPEDLKFEDDANGVGKILKRCLIESGTVSSGEDETGKTINSGFTKLKDGSKLIKSKKNLPKKSKGGIVKNSVQFFFGRGTV